MTLMHSGASRTAGVSRHFNCRRTLLPVLAFSLAACETPAPTESASVPMEPRFAAVTNPRATFTYYQQAGQPRESGFTSGFITGDGRDAGGVSIADSSVYDDGRCGVQAHVFIGASGDATMDPTANRMSNCNNSIRRSVTLAYGTPIVGSSSPNITAAHFTNVREVQQLAYVVGGNNVAERRFRLQPRGTTACDYVRYGDTVNGAHVTFSTTIGVTPVTSRPIKLEAIGPDEWIASSQPDGNGKHVAVCEVAGRKGTTYTAAYDIPFRIRVRMKP